jgi:hypothetical protein
MERDLAKQILEEMLPYLEKIDTESAAILQLLKDKKLTTDEEFATYLEQAGNATNIKWLGARVRIEHLLAGIGKEAEKEKENAKDREKQKDAGKGEPGKDESRKTDQENRGDSAGESQPPKHDQKSAENEPGDAQGNETDAGSDKPKPGPNRKR